MKVGLFALPATFLLTLAILVIGCGGGSDTLTLEEYFAAVEAIDADADSQFEVAHSDFPETEDPFTDEASLPFFKDLIAAFKRIYGDSLSLVENLDPPSEVEDAHKDLVGAFKNIVVVAEEADEVTQEADTIAEVSALAYELDPRIKAATTRLQDACLAVVDIAVANGIHTNISCEDH